MLEVHDAHHKISSVGFQNLLAFWSRTTYRHTDGVFAITATRDLSARKSQHTNLSTQISTHKPQHTNHMLDGQSASFKRGELTPTCHYDPKFQLRPRVALFPIIIPSQRRAALDSEADTSLRHREGYNKNA